KMLEHRVCALSCIEKSEEGKNAIGSVFVKVAGYAINSAWKRDLAKKIEKEGLAKTSERIKFIGAGGETKAGLAVEAFYAGERAFRGKTDGNGTILLEKVIGGKTYKIIVHGEKKKDARTFNVIAGKDT